MVSEGAQKRSAAQAPSPAMVAGVTARLWDIEDIVRLVDEAAPKPQRPVPGTSQSGIPGWFQP